MGSVQNVKAPEFSSEGAHDVLKLASEQACLQYIRRNPISNKNHDEACKYMPGGNTRTVLHISPFPLTIESGQSCYLKSADGHQYVDFLGEYTAGIYGHNHPFIRRAMEQALDGGWNFGGHTLMEQKLAKTVCERFPAMALVRFVNSGTEANTMALATALAYTGKKGVLIFRGAYHGGTISGKPHSGTRHINLPHEFILGEFNDVSNTRELVESLPENNLAAIIVEPMLGSAGCFSAKPEFLQYLRDLATQYNALLIFDEVMTSRLGYRGLGHSLSIVPDLMTLGKWIGGGMTFGAFGGREDLMRMYDPRTGDLSHPGTFNNNVFTMTAGLAGCQLLNDSKIRDLNQLGDRMRLAIEEVLQKYGFDGRIPLAPLANSLEEKTEERPPMMFVTGVGSLLNVHFTGPAQEFLRNIFYHHMLAAGIYMAQRGFIALSIEINQTHVDKFVHAVDEFCQSWAPIMKQS